MAVISNQTLQEFVTQAPIAMAMFDRDMRYLAVSDRWLKNYKIADGNIIGKSHYDIFPEIPDRWKRAHMRGMAGEELREDEDEFVRIDGSIQFDRWHLRPWQMPNGEIGGIIITTENVTAQVVAQRALRASQAELKKAQAIGKIGSWKVDLRTNELTLSDETYQLLRLPRDLPLRYSEVLALIHPDDAVKVDATWRACLKSDPYDVEYRVRVGDDVRWMHDRAELEYDRAGKPIRVFGTIQDVTSRRIIEEKRRESEERLRLALDAGGMGIWDWDLIKETYSWNDQFYRLLGYEPGSVPPGRDSWARRIHPDDLPGLVQQIPELLTKGREFHAEHRVLGKDDEVRWVESRGRFVADSGGRPIRYFGVMMDITERKSFERELREREERLRLATDAADMGIWDWNVREGTYRWNDVLYRKLGYEPNSVPANLESWAPRVHPDDLPRLYREAQELIEEPREAFTVYRVFGMNDELHWLEARGRFECDSDGRPTRYYGVLIDITERKRAEEKDRILTAEVNHRAKNLLAVVQAVAQQMARTDDPKEFAQNFNERLAGLAACHDLLVQAEWRGVDIASLIRAQLSHFGDLIGTRILLNGPQVLLKASAAQNLGMALHELATNASKYGALSSPTGMIHVSWGIVDRDGGPKFEMHWREQRGPVVTPPTRRGFGQTVMVDMLEYALEAQVSLTYEATGLVWHLEAPVGQVIQSPETISH